jgi:hypothetical protein
MSTANTQRARQIARITALVDACLEHDDEKLMAIREAGWDAQKILSLSETLKDTETQRQQMIPTVARSGKTLAAYAASRYKAGSVAESVRKMADRMANLEFRSIPSVAETSLQALNYSTRVVMRGKRCAIEASGQGNAKLLVLIEDRGARNGTCFRTDWANLADMSCQQMQDAFEEKMRENGVALSSDGRQETAHMDPRGGQLIKEAGRMHAEDLATGILLHAEQSEPFCQSLYDRGTQQREEAGKVQEGS